MRIFALGDAEMVTGFRTAGVEGYVCDAAAARTKVKELADCAIIITTESVGEAIRDEMKGLFPILVEVPDKRGPILREKDPMSELLKKAVGVEVRLK